MAQTLQPTLLIWQAPLLPKLGQQTNTFGVNRSEIFETAGSAGGFGTIFGSNIPAPTWVPIGQNTSSSTVTGMFGGGQQTNTVGVSQNISFETTGSAGGFGTRLGSNIPAPIWVPFGQNTSSSTVTGMFGGGQQTNTFGVSQNIGFETPGSAGGFGSRFGSNIPAPTAGPFRQNTSSSTVTGMFRGGQQTNTFGGSQNIGFETTGSAGGFGTTRFGSNIPAPTMGHFGQNTSSSTVTGMFEGGQQTNTFGESQNTSFGGQAISGVLFGLRQYTSSCMETGIFGGGLQTNTFDYSDCQRTRAQIRKQFAWLKDEMDKYYINKVADALYNDCHLVWHAYERIVDNYQPRRNRIDLLLKKVILGNASIVQAFMHILQRDEHLSFFAERINETDVSPEEMHGRLCDGGAWFHISNTDTESLSEYLVDVVVVDQISDNLLSEFYISIWEHTRICDHSEVSKKVYVLLELMKKCPDEVYYILENVLVKNKLEHALQCLERNRIQKNKRVLPSIDEDHPSKQKQMRACYGMQETASCAEMQIVSGLKRPRGSQELSSQASSQLNLKFRGVSIGSS